MKKKELKSKMIVKLRDGSFYLVVDDVLVKENYFNLLSQYSDNLLSVDRKDLDIVEIFTFVNKYYIFKDGLGIGALRFNDIGDNGNLKSIWKRNVAYDGLELVDGNTVYIVSKNADLCITYGFNSHDYNEDFKYFCSETTARIYLSILNNAVFSFNDYIKMSEKEFEEHCENIIREEFLKRLKDGK